MSTIVKFVIFSLILYTLSGFNKINQPWRANIMKKKIQMLSLLIIFSVFLKVGAADALMLKLSTQELVSKADVIVHGFVVDKETFWAENPGAIETKVSIYVENRIKGAPGEIVQVIVPGGIINGHFMFVTDFPDFRIGQEVVVFLDKSCSKIVGQIQGKVTIKDGLVLEMMVDASLYLDSVISLVKGISPPVPFEDVFAGISTIEGYLDSLVFPSFGYDGLRWPVHEVSVYINENCEDVSGEGKAIKTAMKTWSNVKADFLFIYAGQTSTIETTQNNRNEAFFSNTNQNPDAIAWCSIMGHGLSISEVDLTFLEKYDWSDDNDPRHDEMDVQSIATHELGHFLCLLDLYDQDDYEKTMYGYGSPGDISSRTLHQDDKDGIIHIYGPGPGVDDELDIPPNVDNGLTSEKCEKIISTLYQSCGFKIRNSSGGVFSVGMAYDKCDYGSSSINWACIENCYDDSDGCSDFVTCSNQMCDQPFVKEKEEDQDDGGGICG